MSSMRRRVAIAATLLVATLGVGAVLFADHWRDRKDYETFSSPKETDLTLVSGRVTRVSDHIPHVEIEFEDGHYALATFITYPIYRGKSLYVQNPGPFDLRLLSNLLECSKVDFELLPAGHSLFLVRYWIYAVTCDGMALLTYRDTMNYLRIAVDR